MRRAHRETVQDELAISVFGRLVEDLGEIVRLEVIYPMSVGSVRQILGDRLGDPRIKFVVNNEIVTDTFLIKRGQQVELLSPLSGG